MCPFCLLILGRCSFQANGHGWLPTSVISVFDDWYVGCMEAIDLTQDDDDIIYIPPAKRARHSGGSDVELVENPGPSQVTSKGPAEERHLGAGEDFVVTRETGQARIWSPLF